MQENFILPKKLGLEATKQNLYDLNVQKAAEEKRLKEILEEAKAFGKKLEELTITVSIKMGEGGKNLWFCIYKGNCRGQPKSSTTWIWIKRSSRFE